MKNVTNERQDNNIELNLYYLWIKYALYMSIDLHVVIFGLFSITYSCFLFISADSQCVGSNAQGRELKIWG